MQIDKALELARDNLVGGMKLQLEPGYIHEKDRLGVSVTLVNVSHLENKHLEMLLDQAKKYECSVIVENGSVKFI